MFPESVSTKLPTRPQNPCSCSEATLHSCFLATGLEKLAPLPLLQRELGWPFRMSP